MEKNALLKRLIIFVLLLLPIAFYGENITNYRNGYIGFLLKTENTITNGYNDSSMVEPLFEIKDLGKCYLIKDYSGIIIRFSWLKETTHKGFYIFLNKLKANEKYFIQYTWDAQKAKSDLYVNGVLIRTENEQYYKPWKLNATSTRNLKIINRNNLIRDIKISNSFLDASAIKKKVPKKLMNSNIDLFLNTEKTDKAAIESQKGEQIFFTGFSNSSEIKDWVVEGPGKISFVKNEMIMESEIPNPPDGSTGHFNFWCPKDFPDNIIIEWEFAPISNYGVCHLFFSARGKNGEDIFDIKLKKRDGHYTQYHSSDINNYFIIYFSNWSIQRTTNFAITSLHKSNPYSFVSHGKIGINPGENKFNKLQLIKKNNEIKLYVNGLLCFDFKDDGTRYGAVNYGGKIGFRQMAETRARYKNFRVYRIKD